MEVKYIMSQLLTEIELYPELVSAFSSLNDYAKYKLISSLRNMNRGMLYESPIHGAYHSEKVTLFCLILGAKLGCTNKELDILADAGMYHDFMRETDNEDTFHGLASANNIDRVIPCKKYSPSELKILKSIIDYHSTDTRIHDYEFIAENHDVDPKDIERGKLLANILRDADALDRCRFSKESTAYLKPEFLNFPESLDLIKLSEEVNNAYLGKMFTDEEILANPFLHKHKARCLHSIGKNIFRLNSVLEHGLLSYSRFSQLDPSFQRNFDGGNSDKWISVVPSDKLSYDSGASKEFLSHGIVIMFDEIDLYYPDGRITPSYAKSYGLPYTKNSGYSDEQYAFDFIPKEKILGIRLDPKFAKQNLFGLDHYVYDSFNYDLFERNVISYLEKMGLYKDKKMPDELLTLMNKYKDITKRAENASLMAQDIFAEEMMKTSHLINLFIGKKLSEYYRKKLDLPEDTVITMESAVLYELSLSNFDVEKLTDEIYMLTPKNSVNKKGTYL